MPAEQGKAESTGGYTQFLDPSSPTLTPCRAPTRWKACGHAGISALLQLMVGLTVLTAAPVQAQTTPARTDDTHSGIDWVPTEDLNDVSVGTVGMTPKPLPKITITASRDTIFGGLEDMRFVLERDQAGDSMTVRLWLHQDEDWLDRRTQTRYVYFNPNETTAVLRVHRTKFNAGVTRTGCILAKVLEVSGQDYSSKKVRAGVWVVSSPDPLIKLFVGREVFTDAEDAGQLAGTHVVAVMADGMYRGVSLFARISTRGKGSQPGLTATPGEDYEPNIRAARIDESSFKRYDDTWVGGGDFVVPILDDNLREGDESFEIVLEPDPELAGLVRYEQVHEWTECGSGCPHRVNITDNEEMPAMDLSVSEDAIMEEGETSSIAMVSIADGVRFADDQVLTLELGGTATMNADYAVAPADADRAMPGYQRVLPARSASIGVALKAMSDDVDDPGEMIEVSAALHGDAIGQMQAIEIMNQEVEKPKITLAANRDNVIAGLEDLEFTLTREGPVDQSLTLTVLLAQDQRWIPFNSCPLTFAAGQSTATATLRRDQFSGAVAASGQLTASVQAIDGYDVHGAEVTVFVVSQAGPAVTVSFGDDAYRFGEDSGGQFVTLVAQAAAGMPRGTAIRFSVTSRNGTASSGEDFQPVRETITLAENDFALDHGSWRAQHRLSLRLLDDQVREGPESFDILMERASGQSDEVQGSSAASVQITDDEDIPKLGLSVSAREISEENQTSATASVAIGNGKTFATDEILTFAFAGSATNGDDYEVAPADADAAASGHQVALRAGSKSAKLTLTARNDDVAEPNESIEISVTHAGDAIGSESIGIQDHRPVLGPTAEITFEGVQAPPNHWVKGTATGPFTARFTFSEPVRDFEQWQIHWNTHAETTVDGTPISVLFWDFTEVRRGIEYSVRIMPAQNGVLWIGVKEGKVTSVSTGAANKLSVSPVQIEMPPDRMLVAPTELTLDEGDASGAEFVVVLTSASSGAVTVTTSGMEGTQVKLDRPTVTFSQYWNSGRVVKATAGVDADRKDETVTLTLNASGGGYDGQSANVVVTVRDSQSGSSGDVAGDIADEASDLILAEGVTPEAAAAALFGEKTLSEAQLVALDRLGNRNGTFDLGDMLSWIERCRQSEANCGETSSQASRAIPAAAALAAAGRSGRSNRQGRQDSGSGHNRPGRRHNPGTRQRTDGLSRRRSSRAWYGFALLLAATMTWGCADDVVQPPVEPDPGPLTVWLTTPLDGSDTGAMLRVEGPGIELVHAPGLEVFQSGNSSSKQIIVSGVLSSGPVLELQVPDRTVRGQYRVELLQVAGDDYSLRDLSEYSTAIVR